MKKVRAYMKFILIGLTALLLALPIAGLWLKGNSVIVKADTNGGLEVNAESSKEVSAFGFSTEQPQKETPSGKEVDKTQTNPMGSSVISMNRISGLAVSGITASDGGMMTVYKTPFTTGFLNMDTSNIVSLFNMGKTYSTIKGAAEYAAYMNIKAMTSADLNGDLRQEAVTAVLIPATSGKVKLGIMVRSYAVDANKNSTGYTDTQTIVTGAFAQPASTNNANIDYPFHIVSGDFDQDNKDELAIVVGTTVYTCEQNNSGVLYKVSEYTFKMPASPLYGDQIGLTSAYGDGEQYIIIGGKGSDGKIYLATSLCDAKTEKYGDLEESHYEVGVKGVTKSNMWGIISKEMGLKCVSLTTRTPSEPEYVELGGSIFKYDPDKLQFIKSAGMY